MFYRQLCLLVTAVMVGAAAFSNPKPVDTEIDSERLSSIVKTLASDEFEGRAPGSVGEDKTIAYLIEQFKSLGLDPGGKSGSWTQSVPMLHTRIGNPVSLTIGAADKQVELTQGRDIEVSTLNSVESVEFNAAPVVFVGFGVDAPERDWDDFGDIDLSDKVAVFLVNDPDFSAAAGEPAVGRFGNRRMTYYGRWAYKFEEAARRGAVAALVIHETEAAGYDWSVAASSPGDNFALATMPGAATPVMLQGWLKYEAAEKLFETAGRDLGRQRELARSPDFRAFPLEGVTMSASLPVKTEQFQSRNVLALLPGTTQSDEYLMASAHWDAYGTGTPDARGRTVRPGANDDALGTAGVLELARVLKQGPRLKRSIVFALWTGEESGLLGSRAYAANPVYPLEKTVASFTLDILQTAGLARDVILVGEGQSELENDLARAAQQQGRVVTPENLPENGLFYRADHFSMARQGVPVLLLMGIAGGADLVDGGRAAGDQWIADYVGNCYHKTCDAWDATWNLDGAIQDINVFEIIIRDLADSTRWPQWKSRSEFKAIRDESAASRL